MKKLLILILIALTLTLCIFTVINGLSLGGLNILGIKQIQEKNSELDSRIEQATKLASTDYKNTLNELNGNVKKLEDEKKNYEDMVTISTDEEVQISNQFEKYPIEFLRVRIGNHAKSEGTTIKMDIVKETNNTEGMYNINFTVTGTYISITDFIYAIENDSKLGFKIEEFKMIPGGEGSNLQATFTCKNISIEDISNTTTNSKNTDSTNNADNKNTTNTTNTQNNTNTTNTTNTNNENNTNTSNS